MRDIGNLACSIAFHTHAQKPAMHAFLGMLMDTLHINDGHCTCRYWGLIYLHELGDVELGCPQNLDFADEGVLQGVDALAGLLDLLAC